MIKHYSLPDSRGYFGEFGGRFVPETLMPALCELEEAFEEAKKDKGFQKELSLYLSRYAGRPTPVYFARRLTEYLGGPKIYLKREDLAHTGSHKINNTLGQVLLAKRMGKKRIIAETGAGQHGVATATAAALFGFPCRIYMGEEDMRRQKVNVFRMKLLGAEVVAVNSGSRTLKDAINETIRDWVTNVKTTYYVLGSVVGPHPYPVIVRDFQSIIGKELKKQILFQEKRLPDVLVACVGGGSNSIGMFYPFLQDEVRLVGVEAAGFGLFTSSHGATLARGSVGILHGSKSFLLQDDDGQVLSTHSVAAGLDYPGVGPEHSYLKHTKRVTYEAVTDEEAIDAFKLLSQLEGIIPALESSHAVAYVKKIAPTVKKDAVLVVNISGRGDKDVEEVSKLMRG